MYRIEWLELNRKGTLVTKTKAFKSKLKCDLFIAKLVGKGSFYEMISFGD